MTDANRVVIVDRAGPEIPVVLVKQSPVMAVAVRTLRTYLQGVLGLFVLASVTQAATPLQLASGILGTLELALVGALPAAIVAALMNTIELLAALDVRSPQLRG